MSGNDPTGPAPPVQASPPERVVYLVQQPLADDPGNEISLLELWQTIWTRKWAVVLITLAFTSIGVAYTLIATPWYRADVLLLPRDSNADQGLSSQLAEFSGLASLAGIRIGAGDKEEPFAVLKSRELARLFIEKNGLISVLLADQWDAKTKKWKSRSEPAPDIREAVEYFEKKVRRVTRDRQTGLVTLAIEWTDAELAAAWANAITIQLNDLMRERALIEAKSNIAYLEGELARTNLVSLQQAVGRLLDSEFQKLMLARGNEEFAFRVIDRAQVPRKRFKPKWVLTVLGSSIAGLFFGALFVLLERHWRRASVPSGKYDA